MEEEEGPVYQRLNFLLNQLENGNQAEFARRIGVRSGVVGDMFGKRRNKPSFEVLAKIASAYPQLRVEWLLNGEGEMLKKSAEVAISESSQTILSYMPPAAGEAGVSAGLERHLSEEGGMPSYGVKPRARPAAAPAQLPGLDLLQQVAANTADIQRILALLEPKPQPATTRSN